MKILITGSKGFVGTHLCNLLSKKHDVIKYDIKDGQDIFDLKLLNKKMHRVDIVVHLAAYVSGNESWERPVDYFTNNGIGTFNVINAAINNDVKRVILFSSAAVYGNPLTPYGASKLFAEDVAKLYKDKIDTIILRPFNIYGKGQNSAYDYVIHNFFKGIKNDSEIEIYGDGRQTRDFVFIGDVIDVVEKMLVAKVPDKSIDLGTGKEVEIVELAKMIGNVVNKSYKVKFLKRRRGSKK